MLADRAYSSRAIRSHLRHRGIHSVIPQPSDQIGHRLRRGRQGDRPPGFDRDAYKQRNTVERCIDRRMQWRGLATRTDKLAIAYQAALHLAGILIWTRRRPKRQNLAEAQRAHWQDTYSAHPGMYGEKPSAAAVHAVGVYRSAGARNVLELEAGHGRDVLYFAREGFTVQATDFSATGLEQLQEAARAQGVDGRVTTAVHDVHDPLPLPDASADVIVAHMLLCMALSTKEIHAAVGEIRRVLRPGGIFVYTVRYTDNVHYGVGTAHGDDIYERSGFAVHAFPRDLVDALADGWTMNEVHAFEEGDLPRRLWRVTQTSPH